MSLETFGVPGDLYVARGADVNPNRPVFTGDVFESVPIAGVQDAGMAVVVAHPCSMRTGAELKPRILMAAVDEHAPTGPNAWSRGFFDLTPLPDLTDRGLHVGSFEQLGQARTIDLDIGSRRACLSPFGVNLLQQRFIWYLTRLEVATFRLQEAFSHFFEEVDVMEDWIDTLRDSGMDGEDATRRFDAFIRTDLGGGRTLQTDLRDPQRRASVRQACRAEAQRLAST